MLSTTNHRHFTASHSSRQKAHTRTTPAGPHVADLPPYTRPVVSVDATTPRLAGKLHMFANLLRKPPYLRHFAHAALRRVVRHAYARVPLYRELARKAGIDADQIHSPDQLRALPLVDKDIIVAAGDASFATPRSDELFSMSTSGTSGQSITIWRSHAEMVALRLGFIRPFVWHGARSWHPFLAVASPWLQNRKGKILSRLSKTTYLPADVPTEEVAHRLCTGPFAGITGQTGSIYLVARHLLDQGLTHPLRFVFCYGSTLTADMRADMRRAFSAEPVDLYGTVETGWIAWQCRRRAYHIETDRLIVEILDENDRPVPPGQPGHVVVTSLFGYTQPLIRYRLRDIATLAAEPCACPCRFPVLQSFAGRVNDYLPTPDGRRVSPHFFFHIFDGGPNPVREWRLTQESHTALYYEYVPTTDAAPEHLERGIQRIRECFGPSVQLHVRPVANIPLTAAGKRQCIVSKLRPQALAAASVWHG